MDNIAIALVVIVLAILAAAVYMNNKQHATYAEIIARLTGSSTAASGSSVSHTVNVGATSSGDTPPAPIVTGISPQQYVDACLQVSKGTGGFTCGASWNQIAYLKLMDPKTFATWCAQVAALPECAGTGATLGWIQNLSAQGQGILATLGTQELPIPDVDPRAS